MFADILGVLTVRMKAIPKKRTKKKGIRGGGSGVEGVLMRLQQQQQQQQHRSRHMGTTATSTTTTTEGWMVQLPGVQKKKQVFVPIPTI